MSLELNKIMAAGLTAGVIAMTSGLIADLLIAAPGHHEGDEHQFAYMVEADGETEAAEVEEEPGVEPILALLADADVAAGEKRARACTACHSFDEGGANKVGPNLWNIVNAPHAHKSDFSYSEAISSLEEPWTYSNLNLFLANPKEYAPGTKMSYGGMKKASQRAELIAWMRTMSNDPAPLPTDEEIDAASGSSEEASLTSEESTDDDSESAAVEEKPAANSVLALLADADIEAGKKRSRACAACHSFDKDGPNKVGPNLWDIVNAPHAHKSDFSYSEAISSLEEPWTYSNLDSFLANPKEYAPGTKMSYAGMKKAAQRAELIAWMRTLSDDPAPLPTDEEISAGGGSSE